MEAKYGTIRMKHREDGLLIDVICENCTRRVINMFSFLDYYQGKGHWSNKTTVRFEVSDAFDFLLTDEHFIEKLQCEGVNIRLKASEIDELLSYRIKREEEQDAELFPDSKMAI